MNGDCKAKLAAGTVGFEAGVSLFTDPISDEFTARGPQRDPPDERVATCTVAHGNGVRSLFAKITLLGERSSFPNNHVTPSAPSRCEPD
ncbi:hypothetical protein TNCV_4367791 [Trichonephila clavipes]|nr:hypothetical protein TNCV_4367791 [Trichonephila clavipes]